VKNNINKHSIDWDSADNKEACVNTLVTRIILRLFKEKYPEVVKKIEDMVKDDVINDK